MTHEERRKRRESMAARARHGEFIDDIHADLGVTVETVRSACYTAKVKYATYRWCTSPAPRVLKVIAALLTTKLGYGKLGHQNNISYQAVQQICERAIAAGIPIKKRPHDRPAKKVTP